VQVQLGGGESERMPSKLTTPPTPANFPSFAIFIFTLEFRFPFAFGYTPVWRQTIKRGLQEGGEVLFRVT